MAAVVLPWVVVFQPPLRFLFLHFQLRCPNACTMPAGFTFYKYHRRRAAISNSDSSASYGRIYRSFNCDDPGRIPCQLPPPPPRAPFRPFVTGVSSFATTNPFFLPSDDALRSNSGRRLLRQHTVLGRNSEGRLRPPRWKLQSQPRLRRSFQDRHRLSASC